MSKRNPREGNDSGEPGTPPGHIPPTESAPQLPHGIRRLRKGDVVTFEVGEGVDGPPYAMNVRLVDDD